MAARPEPAQLFELEPRMPVPAGALGVYAAGADPDQAFWLRADPVHLVADRDQVMLFADIQPRAEESTRLLAECNRLLAEDGLELQCHDGYWFLRAERDLSVDTAPTLQVSGRSIETFLPRGGDGKFLTTLMTELQMLLHGSVVNMEREARGESAINGIWFWGGGHMPARVASVVRAVFSDEPSLCGLAKAAGIDAAAPGAAAPVEGTALVADSRAERGLASGDLGRWLHAVGELEATHIAPQLHALRSGKLDVLVLDTGRAGYELTRSRLRAFWRRPRRLRNEVF